MFKKIFFSLSPILLYTVVGKSMEPTFFNGEKVLVIKLGKVKIGDVVVIKDPTTFRLLLKRITRTSPQEVFVEGDNHSESTDSNSFGWVNKKYIMGRVLYAFR